MKLRSAILVFLGVLIGAICSIKWHFYKVSDTQTVARNWQILKDFTSIMRGESPSHTTLQGGMLITEYPIVPEPAIAYLVSKRELNHVDLVFPTVLNTEPSIGRLSSGFTTARTDLSVAFVERKRS
ncbi:hypothetical protein SH449x_003628 [Pirellulaceae bacterium SH449]